MKINIQNPSTGAQKSFDIDDELKLRAFYDKRMSQEVEGDSLGDQFKGYIFKIGGGNDKQGFPMKQGVLTNQRVRLLLGAGHSCFRARRQGERRRKSVRGCIVGPDLSVLQLVVVKKGAEEIPGLTDKEIENRLAPKRASKIRKLFNLTKEDDVRQYVIRRALPQKEGKKQYYKSTKIQRLVTPVTLQRQRRRTAQANTRADARKTEAAEYEKLLAQRRKEAEVRKASISARRASESGGDKAKATAAPTGKVTAAPTKAAAATPAKATGKQAAAPTKAAAAAPVKAAPVKAAAPAKEAAKATTPAKQTAPAKQTGKSGKK